MQVFLRKTGCLNLTETGVNRDGVGLGIGGERQGVLRSFYVHIRTSFT